MTLTEKAQEQISQTLTAGYLRVAVDGGGCSGYRIVLSRETELSLGDQLVSDNVISDATSLALLTEVEWTIHEIHLHRLTFSTCRTRAVVAVRVSLYEEEDQ